MLLVLAIVRGFSLKLRIPIEGITAEVKDKCVVIHSNIELEVLTSSDKGPGYAKYSWIVNRQVPLDSDHSKLNDVWLKTVEQLHLPKQTLGFVTSVDVNKVAVVSEKHEDIIVCAVVTAGVGAAIASGDKATEDTNAHTVNIILLIQSELPVNSMVGAVVTATEAKAAVFRELDLRSSVSGEVATGTASDGIAVACTGVGKRNVFAGTGSKLGELIGRTVKEAVKTCLKSESNVAPGRSAVRRLEERGIKLEELVKNGTQLYEKQLQKQMTKELKQALSRSLKEALTDTNVATLVLAGLRLGEDYRLGLLPKGSFKTFSQSCGRINQTLGTNIGSCIAEADVSQLVLKLKTEKRAFQKTADPFAKDVLSGLVAGALYKVCKNRLHLPA